MVLWVKGVVVDLVSTLAHMCMHTCTHTHTLRAFSILSHRLGLSCFLGLSLKPCLDSLWLQRRREAWNVTWVTWLKNSARHFLFCYRFQKRCFTQFSQILHCYPCQLTYLKRGHLCNLFYFNFGYKKLSRRKDWTFHLGFFLIMQFYWGKKKFRIEWYSKHESRRDLKDHLKGINWLERQRLQGDTHP